MTTYDRAAVLRILRVSLRQLQGWEKAGLIEAAESYSFSGLSQIKKLRDLSALRVRSDVIRRSLQQMRLASGMSNPLQEASSFPVRGRVAFRHSGSVVEPLAGQFVMDFDGRQEKVVSTKVREMRAPEGAADLFARGVALEDDPATQAEAIACYLRCVELDPGHAAAYINLGTLAYNAQDYPRAEEFYRKAALADPRYALAFFDLGNVLDETGRLAEAVEAYKSALRFAPTYADAHYNLALAYERLKSPRKALAHWRAYVKLDAVGPWSLHAKQQIAKILKSEGLRVVGRR